MCSHKGLDVGLGCVQSFNQVEHLGSPDRKAGRATPAFTYPGGFDGEGGSSSLRCQDGFGDRLEGGGPSLPLGEAVSPDLLDLVYENRQLRAELDLVLIRLEAVEVELARLRLKIGGRGG